MSPPGAEFGKGSKVVTAKPDMDGVFADRETLERELNRAVAEEMLRHKRLGEPVYVWRDGRVVKIPPEDIPGDL
jgi:hypothetical protein